MAQKIGRNAPCSCGSGLKFKKCCGNREPIKTSSQEYDQLIKDPRFAPIINARREGHYQTGFRPVPSVMFQNMRVRFVGSRVYFRPSKETFQEFLIYVLQSTLGKEWHDVQRTLPFAEQHQIFKWFRPLTTFKKSLINNPRFRDGQHYGDLPTGEVFAVTALAYDLFYLLQIGPLPDDLLTRLKDRNEFQGARYEIAVAAILVRAGCIPTFLHEKSRSHHDINAKDLKTGIVIAVEAKSRHRPGALGFPGEPDLDRAIRGDVERLINEALEQNPGDRPFMIFVDLNSPHNRELPIQQRPWYQDVWTSMQSLKKATPDDPDEFNSIFLTNFSYHWQGSEKATGGEYLLIHSGHPKHRLPPELSGRILDAVAQYGSIPKDI